MYTFFLCNYSSLFHLSHFLCVYVREFLYGFILCNLLMTCTNNGVEAQNEPRPWNRHTYSVAQTVTKAQWKASAPERIRWEISQIRKEFYRNGALMRYNTDCVSMCVIMCTNPTFGLQLVWDRVFLFHLHHQVCNRKKPSCSTLFGFLLFTAYCTLTKVFYI